jgi:hypothetical protein
MTAISSRLIIYPAYHPGSPAILKGIEDVVCRPDLLTARSFSSSMQFGNKEVGDNSSKRVLGALLDAVAHGLRNLPHLRCQPLPRMADFALWATAGGTAFASPLVTSPRA